MVLSFDTLYKVAIWASKVTLTYVDREKDCVWVTQYGIVQSILFSYWTILIYTCILAGIHSEDPTLLFRRLSWVLMYIQILTQNILLLVYRDIFANLIESVKKDYIMAEDLSPDEREKVYEYVKHTRLLVFLWSAVAIACVTFYITVPLITMTYFAIFKEFVYVPVMPITYPEPPLENGSAKINIVDFFWSSFYTLYVGGVYLGVVPMGVIFMLHACGQLEVMKLKVMKLFPEDEVITFDERTKRLKHMAEDLQRIFKFVDWIKIAFRLMYEMTCKEAIVFLPISMFIIVENLKEGKVNPPFLFIALGAMLQMTLPCYCGSLLIEKGDQLRKAFYFCGWEKTWDRRTRTSLLLMLTRMNREVSVSTVFSSVSLETLADVKERGILKLEPRARTQDTRVEVATLQAPWERSPASPQPSVDRLSVTWAEPDPGSMASSVNLFHLPSEPTSEVKFSSTAAEGSEDEDYSASLSAVLRQRRASVRRSRKGRARRPSSPFLPDEPRARRRSSVFTTSSGDTAISIEETQTAVVTQEQIFENIHLHKEVLGSVKQQPLGMRRKLKLVRQAKTYIKKHEGQLQERLAQSKSTRDIYARFNILLNTKWQQMKREAANTSNLLIPWEARIKEIESHFGSVVASYFTFLRWLFWVNLVIAFILLVFVIVPEYLTANPLQDGERKIIMEDERRNSTNLLTLWEFEGVLKFSPIFYGYYSNVERPEYRMPLAYFLTGLVVYIYSFVAILRKMAENSRMSKLSEKEDECIFSWKLFTGWDFMIGNAETAHNRIASVILGFKEALLEEAEKKKDVRNWRIISLRALVNICVLILLVVSAYAVVYFVSRSDNTIKSSNWWRENETTIVVTVISITFPVFFELLGYLEHYHPRKQLRLQLARIMLLNLLNLYSLIFALFSKIGGMGHQLNELKPTLSMNASFLQTDSTMLINESLVSNKTNISMICYEVRIDCEPCLTLATFLSEETMITAAALPKTTDLPLETIGAKFIMSVIPKTSSPSLNTSATSMSSSSKSLVQLTPSLHTTSASPTTTTKSVTVTPKKLMNMKSLKKFQPENLMEKSSDTETTTEDPIKKQQRLIKLLYFKNFEYSSESTENDSGTFSFYDEDAVTREPDLVSKNGEDYGSIENVNSEEYTQNAYSTNDISSTDSSKTTFIIDDSSSNTDDTELTYSEEFNGSTFTEHSTDEITTETAESFPTITDYSSTQTNTFGTDYSATTQYYSTYVDDTTIARSTTTNNELESTPNTENTSENASDLTQSIEEVSSPYTSMSNTVRISTLNEPAEVTTDETESTVFEIDSTISTLSSEISTMVLDTTTICPNISFNCTAKCKGHNVTQVFFISNCTNVEKKCFTRVCEVKHSKKNGTMIDIAYTDERHRKMYNLTIRTKKKLLKLCWETMFGQELVKLTMMDLVFVLLGTLFMDFFRALFVRYMNRCWCWDLEKKFPEYGDFKIAENILHLINNQGMVWMGMFFSPGLVVLNVSKLMIMMYLRSWAVMTCNVPHEVVFRVSKSNNFYLALLLTMLFLCVLPVGYSIVWVKPSWHCGPFSEYDRIYYILTSNIYKILPESFKFALEYIASPAIVIPLLVLLILIIYYLTSLTNSLREANNDLKIQLRRERTEERRKMFQLADTRRRVGSSALDNTPFARWKKALPALPLNKSIDSDDRKTVTEEGGEPVKITKKRGGLLAKIVGLALDKKSEGAVSDDVSPSPNNADDETDTDFHETLPKEVLKFKDITIIRADQRKKNNVEFRTEVEEKLRDNLKVKLDKENRSEKRPENVIEVPKIEEDSRDPEKKPLERHHTTDSNSSRQSDSFGSIIPVITISTTESDDEVLHPKKKKKENGKEGKGVKEEKEGKRKSSDVKSLRRQSSVDSEHKPSKDSTEVQKYQHSL